MNVQQTLEILKITGEAFSLLAWYTATLVKYLAWPVVPIGIVWILRKPIRGLIAGISDVAFEYKGAAIGGPFFPSIPGYGADPLWFGLSVSVVPRATTPAHSDSSIEKLSLDATCIRYSFSGVSVIASAILWRPEYFTVLVPEHDVAALQCMIGSTNQYSGTIVFGWRRHLDSDPDMALEGNNRGDISHQRKIPFHTHRIVISWLALTASWLRVNYSNWLERQIAWIFISRSTLKENG